MSSYADIVSDLTGRDFEEYELRASMRHVKAPAERKYKADKCREYYQRHREHILAVQKKYRENHKEELAEKQRERRRLKKIREGT